MAIEGRKYRRKERAQEEINILCLKGFNIYSAHITGGEYMYILYTMYVHIHVHHKQAEPR